MNHHLNLFRFFNESDETVFIENNLSRAFALCLSRDSFFLNEYLQAVVSDEDYRYLYSYVTANDTCSVDIQVDTATIDKESFKTVYAIAMTSDKGLGMDDFFSFHPHAEKRNVTDIFISIKDIAIVIEVKRNASDCKSQLYQQITPFLKDEKETTKIAPASFSWQEAIALMEKVRHMQLLTGQSFGYVMDFLDISEARYPEWFEPKPFAVIRFEPQGRRSLNTPLVNRMRQALAGVTKIAGDKYGILPYGDRLGISVPFGWASELIPEFEDYPDSIGQYVVFYIWPGNTKQQGYSVYNNPLDWTTTGELTVDGEKYELEVVYNIKFSHFNRFVAGINFYPSDITKLLHTRENFYHVSGKKNRTSWPEFEMIMDSHFKPDFDWRSKCRWEESFLKTDRSYFTMSLGFEVRLWVPYEKLREIDKAEGDVGRVTDFIYQVVQAYKMLLS